MADTKIKDLTSRTPVVLDEIPINVQASSLDGKITVGAALDIIAGDVDVNSSGTSSIGTGVIVNADVNVSAAIDATKIADGTVTSAEFQFINTLSSNAQTQIDTKVTSGGALGTPSSGTLTNCTGLPDAGILSTADVMISTITFIIDGGGSTITTGLKGDLEIPFNCTINRVTLLADQSGSIVIDIWKDTYANYPPTVADTITASAKPTISTATKSQDATLTGWTTGITAGDTLRFNVDSITTCTRVTLSLKVTKT